MVQHKHSKIVKSSAWPGILLRQFLTSNRVYDREKLTGTGNMIYLWIQLLMQIVFLKYYIPECIVAHFMVQNVKKGRVIEF